MADRSLSCYQIKWNLGILGKVWTERNLFISFGRASNFKLASKDVAISVAACVLLASHSIPT